VWRCRCDCGNEKLVSSQSLLHGVVSCGCAVYSANKQKIIDLSGQKFGRLTVVELTDKRIGNSTVWKCQCDCGNICFVSSHNLRAKVTQSCGCLASDSWKVVIQAARKVRSEDFLEGTDVRRLVNHNLQSNNTSGTTGVSYDKSIHSWRADIVFQGRRFRLGARRDKEEAIQLRKEAEKRIHGNFLAWYAQEYPKQWEALREKFGQEDNQND
jgi:hypothetical protein